MRFGAYHFLATFTEAAQLPAFKGSCFRGVFGNALRNIVCALKRQTCEGCLLAGTCIYCRIFETPRAVLPSKTAQKASPPHPFIIEPPLDSRTHYHAEENFHFSLILLGTANEYLPYFIYACEQMGQKGIGRAREGRRPGFTVNRVETDGQTVYVPAEGVLRKGTFFTELDKEGLCESGSEEVRRLTLDFLTPVRLKHQNSLAAELPFHVLMRGALRRISSLFEHYGDGEPNLDYRGLIAQAAAVEIAESTLHWHDWRRYSSRQEQTMLMGGMFGRITYRGDLTEFMPFLRFCEKVHVGKQTTFGLGQYRLEVA